jgi:hypothetical protein
LYVGDWHYIPTGKQLLSKGPRKPGGEGRAGSDAHSKLQKLSHENL